MGGLRGPSPHGSGGTHRRRQLGPAVPPTAGRAQASTSGVGGFASGGRLSHHPGTSIPMVGHFVSHEEKGQAHRPTERPGHAKGLSGMGGSHEARDRRDVRWARCPVMPSVWWFSQRGGPRNHQTSRSLVVWVRFCTEKYQTSARAPSRDRHIAGQRAHDPCDGKSARPSGQITCHATPVALQRSWARGCAPK